MGEKGDIKGMEGVNDRIVTKVPKREERMDDTLILDPTIMESDKREVQRTCLRRNPGGRH